MKMKKESNTNLTEENNLKVLSSMEKLDDLGGSNALSIVYDKNSKRIKLCKELIDKLGYPSAVSISFFEKTFVVIAEDETSGNITLKGDGNLIYNTKLVQRIKEAWELEFDTKVSQSVGRATYDTHEGKKVAILTKL